MAESIANGDLSARLGALSPERREALLHKLREQSAQSAREPEIAREKPGQPLAATFDVVIMGGGLAGQTLARQLKRARPSISILVTELRPHPVKESAHKVGESTVEIGAYYLDQVLGLDRHLATAQLRKAGLRYFFPRGDNGDAAARVEMGATYYPPVPSYQLDRGRLENTLAEENIQLGVQFRDRCKSTGVTRDGDMHYVALDRNGERSTVAARWVVDASGRAGLLKRQLGLARETDHNCNAVWFRLSDAVDIDEWSDEPEWRSRIPKGLRRMSTNHFMGRGYWVWFIPLATGATSVGIVCDAALHPMEEMRSFDRALDWMKRHEPQCACEVESRRAGLMDFLAVKHYAYGCARVFSGSRWALTGEAGVFTDPFYSPGSDFIGMSNTFVSDLILRDLDGEDIGRRANEYNRVYLNTYESFLTVYENQYPLMGSPQVMAAKIVWDFAIYWGFLTLQFMGGRLCDLELLQQAGHDLQRVNHLNARMQLFFREWDALSRNDEYAPRLIDVLGVEIMRRLHYGLRDELPGGAMLNRFSENLKLCESLAAAIFHEAAHALPEVPRSDVNPYVITLDRARWEPEGLFAPGKTVAVDAVAAATMDQIRLTPLVPAGTEEERAYAH